MARQADLAVEMGEVRTEDFEMESPSPHVMGNINESSTDNMANVATIKPIPPNGGYGWVCAFAVFLINSHTWGINASWAVIMAHYATHPKEMPASFFEYSLVGGLSISAALITSPLVTVVRKRIGLRLTLILGSLLLFISLITSSFATKIWQLFLSQGVCIGLGMGLSYISGAAVLPPWFTSRRSLAVGCATAGVGVKLFINTLNSGSKSAHGDPSIFHVDFFMTQCMVVTSLTTHLTHRPIMASSMPATYSI